jgi:hypothetical protein
MLKERMIELLELEQIVNQIFDLMDNGQDEFWYQDKQIDTDKLMARYIELKSEFLKPYVIDKTPRGD